VLGTLQFILSAPGIFPLSPPKRRDKGGSHMNRATGIPRYGTREGFQRLFIFAGGHSGIEPSETSFH